MAGLRLDVKRPVLPFVAAEMAWPRRAVGALVTPRVAAMVAVGVAFFLLYLLAYPRSLGEQTFNSPRENVGYLLSQQFARGEGFSYPLLHYDELPPEIGRALTPRDAAMANGDALPKDFAGTMLLHAPFFVLWEPLVLAITPLFAVLAAFVLAKIAEELFDWRVGFGTFVLWLAYPPLLINASYIFTSDTAALFGVLTAMLFFLRYWRRGQRADLLWCAAGFAFATFMRYPNLLLAAFFALALLEARRLRWRDAMAAAGVFVPFAVAVLLFNKLVYGGFTVTGFHLGADLLRATANFAGESFFKFRPEVVVDYVRMYVVEWPILLSAQLAGLVAGLGVAWRRPDIRVPVLVLLGSGLLLGFYYLPQDAWGYTDPYLSASILRYMLPGLAIYTVFLVSFLVQAAGRRQLLAAAAIVGLAGGYGWTSWSAPGGVRDTNQVVDELRGVQETVLAVTEPDAIIATRLMDKMLFPERQTMTMTYMLENEQPTSKGRQHTWQFLPTPERFADVVIDVHERAIPIYLLADFDWRLAKEYDTELHERGYRLRQLRDEHPGLAEVNLFKVVPIEP